MKKFEDKKMIDWFFSLCGLLWAFHLFIYKEKEKSSNLRINHNLSVHDLINYSGFSFCGFDKTDDGMEFSIYKNHMAIKYDEFVIAITGTADKKDWATNVKRKMKKAGRGKYHNGYYGVVSSAYPVILDHLSKHSSHSLSKSKTKISVVCHSKGGGEGKILIDFLVADSFYVDTYLGVAPSNSVDKAVAQRIERRGEIYATAFASSCEFEINPKTFYLTNNTDKIHLVPFFGYRQPGQRVHFDKGGAMYCGAGFGLYFFDWFFGVLSHFGKRGISMVEDHMIYTYYFLLKKNK